MPIGNHSPELDSKLGGMFTHRWTGPDWGEGSLVIDPKRGISVGYREWSDVRMVTDVTGKRRIWDLDTHIADGVRLGVRTVPEPKGQPKTNDKQFWANVHEIMDRHGHPFMMMRLSLYGDPLACILAAKNEGAYTAVLPRPETPLVKRPALITVADAVWGDQWGKVA